MEEKGKYCMEGDEIYIVVYLDDLGLFSWNVKDLYNRQ